MRIVNGWTYVDGTLRSDAWLAFGGARIEAVGEALPPDETWDATGCYVLPGFIDLHIHGFAGRDAMEGADAVRAMAKGLVQHGTTAFLPTTMTASTPETFTAVAGVEAAMAKPGEGAAVLGCHMEGPFFCAKRKGAQPEAYLQLPSVEAFEALTGGSAGVVRLISVAPELPGAPDFIRAMTARGIRVSCGHSDATWAQVMDAVAAGAGQVTHLYNAMSPLSHREPGMVGAALSCPQITAEFIADLIHLHPAALQTMFAAKGPGLCVAITDSMMAGGMPDGPYTLGGQPVFSHDGAARLEDGTLAGSVLTLRRSLQNMVETVGIPLERALPMYTSTPAARLGDTLRGRLAPGCRADIVVMDPGFNIRAVWVGGKRLV
jgi:N-acetylglucosamine-6-phosphate deacetylase